MLTSLSLSKHMTRYTQEADYPFDGSPDGMAADTLFRNALTIQQGVPNIGDVQTAPKTQVNPTHEQGVGRAPGCKNGTMRKAIPINHAFGRNAVKRLGQHIRTEGILASGQHAPGRGKWQNQHSAKPRRGVLPDPETVYLTAAVPSAGATWGEPV